MKPHPSIPAHVNIVHWRENCKLARFAHLKWWPVKIPFSAVLPFCLLSCFLPSRLLGQDAFTGTTVAFFRTPTAIAVAADSIAVSIENPRKIKTQCKIIQIENSNFFVGIAGLSPFDGSDFNYIQEIIGEYRLTGTIRDTAYAVSKNIIVPLTKKMKAIHADPKVDWGHDWQGKPAVGILFFGFEKGVPVAYERDFVSLLDKMGRIVIEAPEPLDCPGNLCANGEGGHVTGFLEEARAKYPTFNIKETPIAGVVENIVQAEIDFYKGKKIKKVGPPISVLQIDASFRLDRGEARWIKLGKCRGLK
jgi:hypothetical protein